MISTNHRGAMARHMAMALLAVLATSAAQAQGPQFNVPDASFTGQVRISEPAVVYPGMAVKLAGSQFKPGQQVRLSYDGLPLVEKQAVADSDGSFLVEVNIPGNARSGLHPIVVSATNPSAALIYPLKVSPQIPLIGQELFDTKSRKLVTGLYQVAYSPKNQVLFATAAVGRPPVTESTLVKVDPHTLEVLASASPQPAPERKNQAGEMQPGGVYAVYGIGLDDVNDTIWVSNTRQNTIAVYRQSDLGLVKQFEPGLVHHSRDVAIDTRHGKAFVSTALRPDIEVFDLKTMEHTGTIQPQTTRSGAARSPFRSMSLALDLPSSQLFVVSSTGEVAVIDTASNEVTKVVAVDGVSNSSGIAYEPVSQRVFVASQGSDNLAIVNMEAGKTVHLVAMGAGVLNVAFDPVSQLAYTSNRGAGTISAVNTEGEIVANLPAGPLPNHVGIGPDGVVYALNKGPRDDPESDNIMRIQRK